MLRTYSCIQVIELVIVSIVSIAWYKFGVQNGPVRIKSERETSGLTKKIARGRVVWVTAGFQVGHPPVQFDLQSQEASNLTPRPLP